jgi:hypothetical protein
MLLGNERQDQDEKRRYKSGANKSCIHRIFSFPTLLSHPWFAQFCFDIAIEDWTAKQAHVECDRFIATEIACLTLASPRPRGEAKKRIGGVLREPSKFAKIAQLSEHRFSE